MDQEQQIHVHQWEELLLESYQASALEDMSSEPRRLTLIIYCFLGWLGNLTCGFCIKQYFLHTCWASQFLWFEGLNSLFHTNKVLTMCHAFTFCSKVTSINHTNPNFVSNSLNVNLKFASKVWRVEDRLTKLDTALCCQEDVCTLKEKIFALTKHTMLNVS